MKNSGRNLVVLFNHQYRSEQAIEQEVECLHELLLHAESPLQFCSAHELVNRNRITSRKEKILREARHFRLRPFRFLINKN
jgi:hypothetical protein